MLKIKNIHTYYGSSYVLQGLSLEVKEDSAIALLGRNGMGKTTTIRSIIGFNPPRRGVINFKGHDINGLPPHRIARMGMGLVPQGKHIYSTLSVEENLTMPARTGGKHDSWSLDRVYSHFPILRRRARNRGNQLSGGEQQMLAIGRALMTNPDLLLMDEPSEGLAPIVVQQISDIIRLLKEKRFSILLVEQNVPMALGVADYVYIISKGVVVHECSPEQLKANEDLQAAYLGVTGR